MAEEFMFPARDMTVDQRLGYPKAYQKMCQGGEVGPYIHGPPSTFAPYPPLELESMKVAQLDKIFPVINPKAKPTDNPKLLVDILWKQLNHLGTAGFDPAVFRLDPYGNVLYYHADSASPLAWDIDHWFPLSRGGLTVPSNLRLLQQQVCKKKHNKLEFLIPWWDFQLGVSVNQFLSIFASSNSDFRRRGLYFVFKEGKNEELNDMTRAESFCFPQSYLESSVQVGLAPAAIFWSQRDSPDDSSVLRPLDHNQQTTAREIKVKPSMWKENESPDFVTNPYQAILAARNSLKQQEESRKIKAEIKKLEGEVNEMRWQNDEQSLAIEELELELIKHRTRAEKTRRLAEEQCSYRNTLEKMIRDTMHQSVAYKEQVRLNHAATIVLKARLESQRVMCDESEKELRWKSKKRDELEKQLRPDLEQARKRLRIDGSLREKKLRTPSQREKRMSVEKEDKLLEAEAGLSTKKDDHKHGEITEELREVCGQELLQRKSIEFSNSQEADSEEDEEISRRKFRQENVERWLQTLLQNHNTQEELAMGIENENAETSNDILRRQKKGFDHTDRKKKVSKGSRSGKTYRRDSSSPSLISGMKKGKDVPGRS